MKSIIFIMTLFISINSMAAGAVTYDCLGKDQQTRDSVSFTLLFSDHAREVGYTNQSVIIEKIGWRTLEDPIILQMFDSTKANQCQKNTLGEIQMMGEHFVMDVPEEGSIAPYLVSFKIDCGSQAHFDVKAYCFFQ